MAWVVLLLKNYLLRCGALRRRARTITTADSGYICICEYCLKQAQWRKQGSWHRFLPTAPGATGSPHPVRTSAGPHANPAALVDVGVRGQAPSAGGTGRATSTFRMPLDVRPQGKEITMITVRVFDPAMCCSTGICGPAVDPQLARFAADLDWLKGQGVSVERFNLAQQPGAFAEDQVVRSTLETKGEAGLPLVRVNGEVKSSGGYPSRSELAAWAGVRVPVTIPLTAVSGGCCGPAPSDKGPPSSSSSGCC